MEFIRRWELDGVGKGIWSGVYNGVGLEGLVIVVNKGLG